MPANRRPRDRAEKRDEIVVAAHERFVRDGYEGTAVSRIAADAGVTTNTVYWYFDDKDHLLVAVLDRLLADALGRYEPISDRPLTERILWTVGELTAMRSLVETVHSRRASSSVIDEWHTGFHALADSLTRADLPSADAEAASHIIAFVVEGLLTHSGDEAGRRAIVELLVDRLAV